ncbi:hypothetical protein OH828_14475 [Streptomyces anulatus]|uniref:hypothetical protein n=1 Tax=Streptomyces anulatus TaxID=1892 RepID=UPI00386CD3E0
MGKHERPKLSDIRAALRWARAHKTAVVSVCAAAVALAATVWPEFPGSAVVGLVRAVLGA